VPGGRSETSARELIRAEDVASARRLILVWLPGDPESMPGSLAGRISQLQFQELKQTGTAAFVLGMTPAAAGTDVFGGLLAGRKYYRGILQRVGSGPVPFSVLLDGQRTTLPALHLKGRVAVGSESGDAELWVLDDAQLPLVLRWSALGSSVTTVRIDDPPAPRGQGNPGGGLDLTKALSSGDCRAEVYGIYFNTGSAVLLPESQAALARIAALAQAHPGWTLAIEGHTDSMGSAANNLTLSKARAMAVRDALIKSHGVAAQQLSAAGFGATRPVESNGTLEGRARNRRVELARQCQ
jgi:outer membrane protein OmpA-like peptidoglycan-associated protein